ncbi:MAG: PorV/PorQ family protein [Bacteroidetes bacterium]|nr:PorV/PorQ family protein [Bacteroidota bacterium]
MKNIYKSFFAILLSAILVLPVVSFAGNKDRSGQAGASELLINPWARSSGWGGVNISNSTGLESMYTNIAGLAFTQKTELIFSHTQWLKGSDININTFGLAQKAGDAGVLGIGVMSLRFGDIPITTTNLPDGGIGNFTPNYLNINLAYAKAFSNSIYGGFNFKVISESISNLSATGVAIDAGIQYVTGEKENVKFGISLKNIGPTMKFRGDGYSVSSFLPGNDNGKFTLEHRAADFELPSQLNIGMSYRFIMSEVHSLTLAGAFISNSFYKDQYALGAEYELKNYLMLRAGYVYEDGITDNTKRTTVFTGPSAGFSIQVPLNKEKGSIFSIDYSYRATDPFSGSQTLAARLSF